MEATHLSEGGEIRRWGSEYSLFALVVLIATGIWIALAVSLVGIIWAVVLLAFSWLGQAGTLAYVRGSAVKLGPRQFPDLYEAVQRLAHQMGLDPVPDVYIMQMGGDLNAFATRLFRGPIVVLYTDLLRACGEDRAARDMIIAHELGHVHAGHLRFMWYLLPGYMVPFLGGALSRAREYTADRYGLRGADDLDGALLGLSILSAGAEHGPQVNRAAMVDQAEDINTGWMTLGQWFASHPPLLKRMVALDPTLAPQGIPTSRGTLRAWGMASVLIMPAMILAWAGTAKIPQWLEEVDRQTMANADESMRVRRVHRDFDVLTGLVDAEVAAGRGVPKTIEELRQRWRKRNELAPFPFDPFDGSDYGYEVDEGAFFFWSSGPDGQPGTEDDLRSDDAAAPTSSTSGDSIRTE